MSKAMFDIQPKFYVSVAIIPKHIEGEERKEEIILTARLYSDAVMARFRSLLRGKIGKSEVIFEGSGLSNKPPFQKLYFTIESAVKDTNKLAEKVKRIMQVIEKEIDFSHPDYFQRLHRHYPDKFPQWSLVASMQYVTIESYSDQINTLLDERDELKKFIASGLAKAPGQFDILWYDVGFSDIPSIFKDDESNHLLVYFGDPVGFHVISGFIHSWCEMKRLQLEGKGRHLN